MTGPEYPAAAGRDRLRVGHADREQVIEALKDAFVQGRLTRDELDVRAGRALAARTRADLAALTADIPGGPAAAGPAARRPRPPCAAGRWPGRPPGRASAWSSRPPPYGSPSSSIQTHPAPIPIIPGLPCALPWPFSPSSRHSASSSTEWAPQWSRGALAGSCRPGRVGALAVPACPDCRNRRWHEQQRLSGRQYALRRARRALHQHGVDDEHPGISGETQQLTGPNRVPCGHGFS